MDHPIFFLSFIRDLKERGGQRLSTLSIKKGTALTTTKVPIKDGQLLFETDTQKIWLDNGTVRLQMGGADTIAWNNITSKPSYYDAKAIKSITRSGTTFTYTCLDGTTGTFTQQDNNTTYSNATTSASGLMTAAMVTKLNGIATVPNAKPGQVVIENGDGTLHLSTERLQPGCEVVSDTFGFAIGETDECKTPIAAAGRVLVYTYEDRDTFIAGEPVCSGPNGTVSRMTREETKEYPERIIGTVSEIPSYTHWGTGNVEVDGRIWIKVK